MVDVPAIPTAAPRRASRRFTRAHLWIVLAPYALITLLFTRAVLSARADDGDHHAMGALEVASAIAAPMLGPFHGGFARHWQSCCATNSWSLFPTALFALAAGCAVQFVPLPDGRIWGRIWMRARLLCWTVGWLFWFGSGILSLGHALE